VYSFTPSTQISMRANEPSGVAEACTAMGRPTVAPSVGAHTMIPGDAGAGQAGGPTFRLNFTVCFRLSISAEKNAMECVPLAKEADEWNHA
jgi:hypothetical protein